MENDKKNALDLSAELGNEEDGEKGHNEKLRRYAKAKNHQLIVWTHLNDNEPTLSIEADALDGCSRTLIFRHWHTVSKYRLIGGCTCKKHLLCAMCALRRSAKTVREVEKKVKVLLLENPSLVPALITMTVRNGHDLSERYTHATNSKKKLLQLRRNALKAKKIRLNKTSITRLIHGSVGSYEFKQGKGGHGWHPHSHEIALLDPSVEFVEMVDKRGNIYQCPIQFQVALSKEWREITGDSFVVDVRKITESECQTKEESLLKAICEASKYALKLNDMEVEDQVYAYKILCGRRLTFSYGSLWGIKIPDDLHDDIEAELALLPYVDLVYSFYSGQYNLSDITDTKDFLVSSKPKKIGSKDEDRKKSLKKITKKTPSRFSDKVSDYAKKVKKEENDAFICFTEGPKDLTSKGLYIAHLEFLKGNSKI